MIADALNIICPSNDNFFPINMMILYTFIIWKNDESEQNRIDFPQIYKKLLISWGSPNLFEFQSPSTQIDSPECHQPPLKSRVFISEETDTQFN